MIASVISYAIVLFLCCLALQAAMETARQKDGLGVSIAIALTMVFAVSAYGFARWFGL